MEDFGEEEDVIMEGSELHRALTTMGYTDFDSAPLNKHSPFDDPPKKRLKILEVFFNLFGCQNHFWRALDYATKGSDVSSKQLKTILQAESLLDDHAAIVQTFAKKGSETFWNKIAGRSGFVASAAILGLPYLFYRRNQSLATFFSSSVAAFMISRRYKEFCSVRTLKNLVTSQNQLYRLYKKSLKILGKVYKLRINERKPQSTFSQLEINRLQYLQPITEALLQSLERVSRAYYKASSLIIDLLPKDILQNDTMTHYGDDAFTIDGEITYEKLRHLYYVYILVQSDTLQLLAIAYNAETEIINGRISHSFLNRIIENMSCTLSRENNKLSKIIQGYESCKRVPIERKFRSKSTTKWKDLYINLDVISKKLQTSYDMVVSVLEEIDNQENEESPEDIFVEELNAKILEISKQIDTAKNFAEFNNLLMAIMRRGREPVKNSPEIADSVPEVEDNRRIIKDSEPLIIDEVFEEYITEEYLKPLCEDFDDSSMENAKFDKLLAKNFMSELREALVDKYKAMSEREAKAWMRKYRKSGNPIAENENNESGQFSTENNIEKLIIPPPPPFPDPLEPKKSPLPVQRQMGEPRRPAILPRTKLKSMNIENNRKETGDHSLEPPLPPPRLPPPPPPLNENLIENSERFSIDLPKFTGRIPAFVSCDEEFVGSGENSEEEMENMDEDEKSSNDE